MVGSNVDGDTVGSIEGPVVGSVDGECVVSYANHMSIVGSLDGGDVGSTDDPLAVYSGNITTRLIITNWHHMLLFNGHPVDW